MNIHDLINNAEEKLTSEYRKIEQLCEFNSQKVISAFWENKVSENHFNSTTGYGYNDEGRDTIEKVYASIFKAEDALVRNQFISGSHALCVCLFSLLRPHDVLLSIPGTPYDTLEEVIGIKDNPSSLKRFGVIYEQIDLIDGDFDYFKIKDAITSKKIKVIEIQRSKGYSTRKSIDTKKLSQVIKFIKKLDPNIIIMVDNCYCEFVSEEEPIELGADVAVGSLIKNLGGGLTSNGAYIVGKKEYVKLASERLNLPGEGKEVGPSLGANKSILQGLFLAPSVVASSLKVAVLTSYVMAKLGYEVEPKYNEKRADIVQNIIFKDKNKLIKYVQAIQSASPIDSYVTPSDWDMPGYTDKVIMASGSFTQGSSIELSCDGPIREPYIAYQQGSLTYEYGKIALIKAITKLEEEK